MDLLRPRRSYVLDLRHWNGILLCGIYFGHCRNGHSSGAARISSVLLFSCNNRIDTSLIHNSRPRHLRACAYEGSTGHDALQRKHETAINSAFFTAFSTAILHSTLATAAQPGLFNICCRKFHTTSETLWD